MTHIDFTLNGAGVALDCAPDRALVSILREDLGLTGTKLACGIGRCGACMVLLDGAAVNACLLMAWQVAGRRVDTIEGLREDPRFAPLFEELAAANSFQCGYCAAGVTVTLAGALGGSRDARADAGADADARVDARIDAGPDTGAESDDAALLTALEGNICRCTGYQSIVHGARKAAARLRAERSS